MTRLPLDHQIPLSTIMVSICLTTWNHTAITKPKCTQLLHDCSTTPPTQELTSFPVWEEQHHLLKTTHTSRLRCLSSGLTVRTITLVWSAWLTAICHCLTLTSCHALRGNRQGQRSHRTGGTPGCHWVQSFSRKRKYYDARKPRDVMSGIQPWRTCTIADYKEKPQEERRAKWSVVLQCHAQ